MTDTFAAVILGSVPLILAQVANIIVSLRNGQKTDKNTVIQSQIHTLVNSQMGAQKQLTAIAARNLALAQPNPANLLAAEQAEKIFLDHQHQQEIVDTQMRLDLLQKGK